MNIRPLTLCALLLVCAAEAFGRGGGGCFLGETPVTLADGTFSPISRLKPGQPLLALSPDGRVTTSTVQNVIVHEVDEYLLVSTGRTLLGVTAEHPFYVGNGIFQTIGSLHAGDRIFTCEAGALSPQAIVSIARIEARATVYDLQTDEPNTFFASGVAVHNKGGGGGGCFPAGTAISTPSGPVAIQCISPGQAVLAIDEAGLPVTAVVEAVYSTTSSLLVLETESNALRTTAEHPVLLAEGGFCMAGDLRPGMKIARWTGSQVQPAVLHKIIVFDDDEPVFNLRVAGPHTFIADGFVVHNKGGGGGGGFHSSGGGGFHSSGGYRYGGRSGTTSTQPSGSSDSALPVVLIVGGVILILILKAVLAKPSRAGQENLDFVYRATDVAHKASKTARLLEFIAKQDSVFEPAALSEIARSTFLKLQQCWQARDYSPMQELMMGDLYAQHLAQINGMKRSHEINIISNLHLGRIDIVNVRYTHKPDGREFTALITATAQDYYIDDRTNAFVRGDRIAATFQEFWTFQLLGGRWLLREIEQTKESDVLKDENFFEPMTDRNVDQIYGDAANKEGPVGPWMEKSTHLKATKIERMLNFLAQTDTLWNRQQMIQRVREVFMRVYDARQSGEVAGVMDDYLFPEVAASLRADISDQTAKDIHYEFRNICIRKVELLLVRNFKDNRQDEFTARVSAHAQRMIRKGIRLISSDDDVVPFEEYWTFGRLGKAWKLKEVLPSAKGKAQGSEENLDEDSSSAQLEWYYRQTRAN